LGLLRPNLLSNPVGPVLQVAANITHRFAFGLSHGTVPENDDPSLLDRTEEPFDVWAPLNGGPTRLNGYLRYLLRYLPGRANRTRHHNSRKICHTKYNNDSYGHDVCRDRPRAGHSACQTMNQGS
jgi:hypothetical protein